MDRYDFDNTERGDEALDYDTLEMERRPWPEAPFDDGLGPMTPPAEPYPAPEPELRQRPARQPQQRPAQSAQAQAAAPAATRRKPREEVRRPQPQPEAEAAPARQPKAKQKKQPKEPRERMRFAEGLRSPSLDWVRDRRWRLFLGIVGALATAYLLIVCISYLANAAHDQSGIANLGVTALASDPAATISNAGGPFGAKVAHTLMNQWLGLGSFILLFWLAVCSLSLLGVRKMRFWATTFACLLSAVTASIVLGWASWLTGYNGVYHPGGMHGYAFNRFIVAVAGPIGAAGISVALLSAVALLFGRSLLRWGRATASFMAARNAELSSRRAERREQRKAKEAAEAEAREAQAAEAEDEAEENLGETSAAILESMSPVGPIVMDEPSFSPTHQEVLDETRAELEAEAPGPRPDSITTIGGMEIELPVIEQAEPEPEPEEQTEPAAATAMPNQQSDEPYDPRADLPAYRMPSLDLLRDLQQQAQNIDVAEQEENKERIIQTLRSYDVEIASIKATVGPTVTLYEITPAEGVRISKIRRLEDDIALQLAALGIRIIAPIPGKGTIGLEVPNQDPQVVSIRSILGSKAFAETKADLPMALGSTIQNEVFISDLAKIPHLLVAGTTGTGKSVGLNTIIASLVYKKHPSELKFVLVDPKMVEFSLYARLEKHYLAKLPEEEDPIITDPQKVVATLNSLCVEMDNRYALLKDAGMRSVKEYNAKFCAHKLLPSKGHRYLPYIVIIVDEFADLIMTAGKEIETPIARIAQKARAVGMHMILATQRPSAAVITGVIRANFPGRIAFRVASMIDSRIILDRPGANQLIGRGDMIFSDNGKMERVQCAFIDTPEVTALCDNICSQTGYSEAYLLPEYVPEGQGGAAGTLDGSERDPLFEEAARWISTQETASTSWLQRRWSIGYNRAGKIMDQLEAAGVVGPSNGAKPRQVLMTLGQVDQLLS